MIFQEPATSLNPVMRVGDQIVEAIEAHTELRGEAAAPRPSTGWRAWASRARAPHRRLPVPLSGGQKQRVMIAIALAAEPDYLIADEPTTALDVTIQAQILDLIRDLQRERQLGVLLITHDLAVVSGMAHRVALMYAGQIVEVPAAEFFARPGTLCAAAAAGVPDATRRQRPLAAIAGTVPPLWLAFEGCRFAPRCDRAMGTAPAAARAADEGPRHQVRCLLYSQPARRAAPAGPGAAGRAARPGAPLLEVRDLRVRFALKTPLLHRGPRHFDAVDGVSYQLQAGARWPWWASPAAARPRRARPSCSCCAARRRSAARRLLEGRDLFQLHGPRWCRRGARCRSSSRTLRLAEPAHARGRRAGGGADRAAPRAGRRPAPGAPARAGDQVGLRRDALQRWPHEFSGGQRQRIAIARALAVEPGSSSATSPPRRWTCPCRRRSSTCCASCSASRAWPTSSSRTTSASSSTSPTTSPSCRRGDRRTGLRGGARTARDSFRKICSRRCRDCTTRAVPRRAPRNGKGVPLGGRGGGLRKSTGYMGVSFA
jgi:peptide/nickel transport system ATP-binding protein